MTVNGLEFGCGDNPTKPEFKGVDVRSLPNVSYVCNAWEISDHVPESSVDEIFSRHFFEHLTFEQADLTLMAWHQILKPGGFVEVIVPDMMHHIQQWLHPDRKNMPVHRDGAEDSTFQNESIKGFWGGQRGELNDSWDVHKSGYDYALLRDSLMNHGFQNIQQIESAPKNLHVKAYK